MLDFTQGKPVQFHDVNPPGKRFGNLLHQVKRLGAGKEKQSLCVGFITSDFNIAEELGRMLDLVHDDRRRIEGQEHVSVGFRLLF